MIKLLKEYIAKAKRDARSINTGWSCTLLAYTEQQEKEIKFLKHQIEQLKKELNKK
jgi:hypothetical protein